VAFVPFVFQKRKTGRVQLRGPHRATGFTFVELLAVVIIIGVLSAIIVPMFLGRTGQARRSVAESNIKDIEAAIQIFYHDYGRFPADLDELITRPSDIDESKWTPVLTKAKNIIDPWDHKYEFRQPGEEGRPFDILSYGADGQPGGEGENADVVSW
jgi:general secretion pathway protein G